MGLEGQGHLWTSLSISRYFSCLVWLDTDSWSYTRKTLSGENCALRIKSSLKWACLLYMVHFFPPCFSYTIMKMCWNLEPTERPTFSKITQMIERLLGDQPEQEQVSESTAGLSDSSLPLQKKKKLHMEQSMWRRCPQETLFFFPNLILPKTQQI